MSAESQRVAGDVQQQPKCVRHSNCDTTLWLAADILVSNDSIANTKKQKAEKSVAE